MILKCDICKNILKEHHIDNQVFSHLNFKNINNRKKTLYQECTNCNLIYNKRNFDDKIFKTLDYSKSNQTSEKIIKFNNKIYTRSDIQANYILNIKKNKKKIDILDIGSFDGKLLFTILKKIELSNPNLYGFDINKSLKKNYNDKVVYISNFKSLKNFYFDIIVLSHSIMYFKNLKDLMKFFKFNLKKDGKIFVQCSDLDKRPYNIYLSDQYFFPNKYSLNLLFKKFGFYSKEIKNNLFKNEFIFIFKKNKNLKDSFKKKTLNEYLDQNQISKIKFHKKLKNIDNFYIFGTTLEAAFVHSLFKNKKIFGFIDENKIKQNKKFRGLKVYQPDKINKIYKVFFPYDNNQLKNYLIKKFNFELI